MPQDEDEPLYFAHDGKVWKRPISRRVSENETAITIGFPVCVMHEAVGGVAAATVAELMNAGDVALHGPVAGRKWPE